MLIFQLVVFPFCGCMLFSFTFFFNCNMPKVVELGSLEIKILKLIKLLAKSPRKKGESVFYDKIERNRIYWCWLLQVSGLHVWGYNSWHYDSKHPVLRSISCFHTNGERDTSEFGLVFFFHFVKIIFKCTVYTASSMLFQRTNVT